MEHYEQGLEFVPNHYKCLVAKFEYYDKVKDPQKAYATVRELLTYYPITPQRLGCIIYLKIRTNNFDDVLDYYEAQGLGLLPKNSNDQKAAMFTRGKYLLTQSRLKSAYQQFESAILVAKEALS